MLQQAEIEKLRWKNQFHTDEISGMESKLKENKNVIAWYSNKLGAMKKYYQDEVVLVNSKLAKQEAEIIYLKKCLSRANSKIVVEVNAKVDEKRRLEEKCEDQADQIAMLEYDVEEQRTAIDELIEAAKKANEKVAERDEAELKPSFRPLRPLDPTSSNRKCVPLKQPLPPKFQGDVEKAKATPMPKFTDLVNFPANINGPIFLAHKPDSLPDAERCCVMCGQACQCSATMKGRNPGAGTMKGRNPGVPPAPAAGGATIPTQNKGLCTACDVNVWVVVQSGLEIKWCKGCKNFCPWASFGDKGLATKCVPCREHQREKYRARQKEAEEKKRKESFKKDWQTYKEMAKGHIQFKN